MKKSAIISEFLEISREVGRYVPKFWDTQVLFFGKTSWIANVIRCAHVGHGHDEDMADRGTTFIASAETYTMVTAFRSTLRV